MATADILANRAVFADTRSSAPSRKLRIALWTVQGLLAALFLMTGSMKAFSPAELLEAQTPLPLALVRFIGLCEMAGALGLILPALLRIQPSLTALAAACLAVLMVCATVLTPILMAPDVVMTAIPFVIGLLAAFVAYGRTRLAPVRPRSSRVS